MIDWNKPTTPRAAVLPPAPPQAQPTPAEVATPPRDEPDVSARFPAREARRTLSDLIVPPHVEARIRTTLERLNHQHTLHHEWGLSEIDPYGMRTVLNLYGPPGTGKTLCAEAIAGHLGKPLLDVNYAELESKFVGETAKNIVAVFEAARAQDAVLFFDEADSLLGKRLTEVRQSSDYGVNQSRSVTLKQLEAHQGVVIFATNMASQYDKAFVRRILAHISMELPDLDCRVRLWERLLVARLPRAEDVRPEALAELTEGFSGGELVNVLINAAGEAVTRQGDARRLTVALLQEHIDHTRAGKEHVGGGTSTVQQLSRAELPPQIAATLDAEEPLASEVADSHSEAADAQDEA